MLYPLVFQPIYKEHVWGGRRLEALYGRPLPPRALIGESWEIADRPEGVSVVANGPLAGKDLRWLMEHHADELLGSARSHQGRFPLLVKILDCQQAPSIQVHPPAEAARRLGGEPKTELWYIIDAEPESHLKVGLRRGVKRGQFERKLGEGDVVGCLHRVRVQPGDAMFVPSGRVHAVGAGIVLFEVQQNSNTTYRIYDWDRTGPDGKPRELHVSQAMASVDFDDYEPRLVQSQPEHEASAATRHLADTPWFEVQEWQLPAGHRRTLEALDRPVILGLATGELTIAAAGVTVSLAAGQFCLVPAGVASAVVETKSGATCLVSSPGIDAEPDPTPEAQSTTVPAGVPPWQMRRGRESEGTSGASAAHGGRRRRRGLPGRREIKRKLTKRLIYSPFLKMLVLFFWFRMAVLALLVVGVTAAVLLPKVWNTTPKGFVPEVRVSLLDKLQVLTLRRSARAATQRGDHQAALQGWRNAFANNMGDPESARGLIRCTLAKDPIPPADIGPAVRTADLLLRLTRTNRADLELACSLYDKAQLYDLVRIQLEPIAANLPEALKPTYVKSLFFEPDLERYLQMWNQLSPSDQARPDMALIHAGYLAGWGDVGSVAEARSQLDKVASERGANWLLANRLQMAVSTVQMDPDRFSEALQRLQQAQLDNGVDNATYWGLLAATGRKSEAIHLASEYVTPPRNPSELTRLAQVKMALGLQDEALRLMQAFAKYFPMSDWVWTTYAAMLLEARHWEELRGAALHMRQVTAFRGRLDALSHYYEGRADLGTGRTDAALRAFDAASVAEFQSPNQSMVAATSLLNLGYSAQARQMLERIESMATNRVQYLDLLSRAAILGKDGPLLLKTGQAAYEIDPTNMEHINRYAAGLIIQEERPTEALRLTLELITQYPKMDAFRINHALALLLNRRPDEAEAVLKHVAYGRLRPDELNSYYQAMFEMTFQKGEYAAAWQHLDRIDWSQLFPAETNRLTQMRSALPPRPGNPTTPSS